MSAEIGVHIHAHLVHKGGDLRVVFLGYIVPPVGSNRRESEHQEDEIHQSDKDNYQFAEPTQSSGDPATDLGQDILDAVTHFRIGEHRFQIESVKRGVNLLLLLRREIFVRIKMGKILLHSNGC